MSTRCYIGRLLSDGSVHSVYCHYDGYPTGVGRVLLNNWGLHNINQLLAGGNIWSLDTSLESTKFQNEHRDLHWKDIFDFAKNGQQYNYLLLTTDRWFVYNKREYPTWIDLQLAINEYQDDE